MDGIEDFEIADFSVVGGSERTDWLPAHGAVAVEGHTGAGKTLLGVHFALERSEGGLSPGQPCDCREGRACERSWTARGNLGESTKTWMLPIASYDASKKEVRG